MIEKKMNIHGISNVKHIVLIASCKGGVGKSTIASNLSIACSQLGFKVGLLDADIYGPSLPIMFGIDCKNIKIEALKKNNDVIMIPVNKYNIKLMSIGFLTDMSTAIAWRGPMITSAFMQMIHQVLWGDLDYLFIDLPPGTGDIQLTIAQNISNSTSIIILTPQDVVLADVMRAQSMFKKVNIPVLGMIENMNVFTCDNCNKQHKIFPYNTQYSKLNMINLMSLPILKNIAKHSDNGMPYVLDVNNDISTLFFNCIKNINNQLMQLSVSTNNVNINKHKLNVI